MTSGRNLARDLAADLAGAHKVNLTDDAVEMMAEAFDEAVDAAFKEGEADGKSDAEDEAVEEAERRVIDIENVLAESFDAICAAIEGKPGAAQHAADIIIRANVGFATTATARMLARQRPADYYAHG